MIRTLRRLFPMPTIHGYSDPRVCERVAAKTADFYPNPPYLSLGNARRILDFGGGAGVHYKQALAAAMDVEWYIVETPQMVRAALEYNQPSNLFFCTSIEEAQAKKGFMVFDLIYSNGALQYIPDPYTTLNKLCSLHAERMIWERTEVYDGSQGIYTETTYLSDHGPGEPQGSEAEVITNVFPLRTAPFLNAHWRYKADMIGDRWTFTRRQA